MAHFLGVFDKLLVNFTWWVNRQDASEKNSNSLANSRSSWPGRATDSSNRSWPGSPLRGPGQLLYIPGKAGAVDWVAEPEAEAFGLPCRGQKAAPGLAACCEVGTGRPERVRGGTCQSRGEGLARSAEQPGDEVD